MKIFFDNMIGRGMTKILIFLMVMQGLPLWELSRSYQIEYRPEKVQKIIGFVSDLLGPASAAAAVNTCLANLSIRSKPGKIQLVWTPVDGADNYAILRGTALDGPFNQIADTQSDYATYLDTTVNNGILYYYQIQPIPGGGSVSCLSDVIAAVAPTGRTRMAFVPNVIGQQQVDAEVSIVATALAVGDILLVDSSEPAGQVTAQDPPPGSFVPRGFAIDITASTGSGGPDLVAVPDVTGLSQVNAEAAIVAANFAVGAVSEANSDTVPAGDVISQNPAAGTSVPKGTDVTLVVSRGPALVTVPDVTTLSKADAETAILATGLTVGNLSEMNSDVIPAGLVISQIPAGGTQISLGSSVDLVISLGPASTVDTDGPVITASLANDTGRDDVPGSFSDGITRDPTISGAITDDSNLAAIRAALGGNTAPLVDITGDPAIQPDGTFTFDRSFFETLSGTPVDDGELIFRLEADDEFGNTSALFDLSFTLLTTPPFLSMTLDPNVDSGIPGDNVTTHSLIDLIGATVPLSPVSLFRSDDLNTEIARTESDGSGDFGFANIALDPGDTSLTVVSEDIAGNRDQSTLVLLVVPCDIDELLTQFTVDINDAPIAGKDSYLYVPGSSNFVGDTKPLAAAGNGRIGVAYTNLDRDPRAEIATVSPNTNEVLLFTNIDGSLWTPIVLPSGAVTPLTLFADHFIGELFPDIVVGHQDGTLTFFEGDGNGNFHFRPDLSLAGLGEIVDLTTADLDNDGDNDLAISGRNAITEDRATVLLNDADPLTSTPIVNGDFSNSLLGWDVEIKGHQPDTISGRLESSGGFARFVENESFLVSLQQTFVIPESPVSISFDLSADLEDAAGGIPDAFEVSLLDQSLNSVVPTFKTNATAFFNANPGSQFSAAVGVTFDGTRVTLDISDVPPGSEVTLFFDLIGNPPGNGSVVVLDNVEFVPDAVFRDTFTRVALPGPFTTLAGIGHCDQNGDNNPDIVLNDIGSGQYLVYPGDGIGNFSAGNASLLRVSSLSDSTGKESTSVIPGAYQLQINNVSQAAATAIGIGDVVSGEIAVPGEVDEFSLEISNPGTVFFDIQDGSPSLLSWSLLDPAGATVFSTSSIQDQGPLNLDEIGAYRLIINGRGVSLDAYQFQLHEVPETTSTPIGIGDVVSGEIVVPGEVDEFSLEIFNPRTVFIDIQDGSSSLLSWSLLDPAGATVFSTSSIQDQGPLTLGEIGTYRLKITGRFDRVSTYQFQIHEVPPTTTTPIGIGEVVSGEITVPGGVDEFTLNIASPRTLFFDLQDGSSSLLSWSLVNPAGTTVFSVSGIQDQGPLVLDAIGTYILAIDGRFDRVDEYQFYIFEVPDADVVPIDFDKIIMGQITVPGSKVDYVFDAVSGQNLFFDVKIGSPSLFNWSLTDPTGQILFDASMLDQGPIILAETGMYTLAVNPRFDNTGEFWFRIWRIPQDVPEPIAVGTPIPGAIYIPGQTRSFQFDAVAGEEILFDLFFGLNFSLFFDLVAPSGVKIFADVPGSQTPPPLPETGTYSLTVRGSRDMLFDFAFQIVKGATTNPIAPAADLIVSEVMVPFQTIGNPAEFDVTTTIRNEGQEAVPQDTEILIRLYLSAEKTLNKVDDPLISECVLVLDATLANGESVGCTQTVAMFADFEGEFRVIAEIDARNTVFENDSQAGFDYAAETNNEGASDPTAVYREPVTVTGESQIFVNNEDQGRFPVGTTILISGRAKGVAGSVNAIYVLDVSGSTALVTGLDSNFDGMLDDNDNLNSDARVGDILDSEIGSLFKLTEFFANQADTVHLAVIAFGGRTLFALDGAEPVDLGPGLLNQTFQDLFADNDGDGEADFTQATRTIFYRKFGLAAFSGAAEFRNFLIGTSTDYQEAFSELAGALHRAPGADQTHVFFLTDGEPSPASAVPSDAELQQLAGLGIRFHGFQITGDQVTDALQRLADGIAAHPDSTGDASLVADPDDLAAIALDTLKIVDVRINGEPVESFDSAGNFFTPVTLATDENIFLIEALDSQGNGTSTTLTLVGFDPQDGPFDQFQDIVAQGEMQYQATTYNRQSQTLSAGANLFNAGEIRLGAPVLAVFDQFTLPLVGLTNSDDVTAENQAFVTFDDELGSAGLDPKATSSTVNLQFGNPEEARFEFNVTLLALGNTAPVFSSAPSTNATVGNLYDYQALATDGENDPLAFELVTFPAGMTIGADSGLVQWTPAIDQLGVHDVEIKASDGRGGVATQSFALQVFEPLTANNPPLIYTDPPTQFSLSPTNTGGNVVDRQYIYPVGAVDADGDPLTFSLLASPAGMTIYATTGEITWDPSSAQVANHEVTVQVSDSQGGVDIQFFSITIELSAPNQSPQFLSAPLNRVALGDTYAYTPTVKDPDFDALTFDLVAGPAAMQIDTGSGALTWAPVPADLGTHTVSIEVSDGFGGDDTQTFNLRVVSPIDNGAPVFTSQPVTGATVGQKYRYIPAVDDPDGDVLTLSLQTAPAGLAVVPQNGILVWRPHGSQIGLYDVILQVDDGFGGQATQVFQILVVADNSPPLFVSAPPLIATVDQPYAYAVETFDADADPTEIALVAGPDEMTFDPDTGLLNWSPALADLGGHRVQLRVTDSNGAAGHQSFDLQVRDVNTAPEFTSDPVTTATIGDIYAYDASAVDTEDEVIYSLIAGPAGMAIDGSTGVVLWSPPVSDVGDHTVTIQTTDERSAVSEQTFQLTVLADTETPVVSVLLSSTVVSPGDTVTITVVASDNDKVANLGLEIDGSPTPLDVDNSALFKANVSGLVPIAGSATDAGGNIGTATVQLRIVDPADTAGPLVDISSPGPGDVVTYLTDIVGTVNASDLEFYRLDYARADRVDLANIGASNPSWIAFAEGNAEVSNGVLGEFDPTVLTSDNYVIRVVAQDFSGNITVRALVVGVAGNAKLGQFSLEFTDLAIPLAGIPIEITRRYNSFEANDQGDFGFGWTLKAANGDIRETVPLGREAQVGFFGAEPFKAGTRVYLTNPDGQRIGFTFEPVSSGASLFGTVFAPVFTSDPGVYDRLEVDEVALSQKADGSFGLFLIGFNYNPSTYRLIRKNGRIYHYDQFAGLQKVTDHNNNELAFSADGIMHSSGVSIQFIRDSQNRITRIIDPAGNSISYDYNVQGNLSAVSDLAGSVSQFTYFDDRAHYLAEMTDPLGRIARKTEYDDAGRLIAVTDAAGVRREQFWDPADYTGTFTSGRGDVTELIFDDRGNLIQNKDPLGNVFEWEYDDNDNEISRIDENGNLTQLSYDELGNVLTQTDAMGNTIEFSYDESNNITQIIDAQDLELKLAYDERDNLINTINSLGQSTTFTRDAQGRALSVTDANGNRTEFVYGSLNLPVQITNPDGSFRRFEYNAAGLPTRVTDETGISTSFAYDETGKLISTEDNDGNATHFDYTDNQLRSIINPVGQTIGYEYDALDRISKVIDLAGGTIEYEYDQDNNVISILDPTSNLTGFEYDVLNQVVERIDPLGNSTAITYDGVGNVTELIDRNGRRRTFEYDALNREITENWHSNGGAIIRSFNTVYDAQGNLAAVSDSDSNYHYTYDGLGQVTSIDNLGTPGSPRTILNYTHDPAGNRVQIEDNLSVIVEREYDESDRLISITWTGSDVDPARVEYEYDDCRCNRITGQRRFADDKGLNLIGSSQFEYDSIGRISGVRHRDDSGLETVYYSYLYDALGYIVAKSHHGSDFDYEYDEMGQLIYVSSTDFGDREFRYDSNGNRASNGTLIEPGNRILSTGVFDYEYDAEGNTIKKIDPTSGAVTDYSYDHRNRLTSVIQKYGNQAVVSNIEFTYDGLDRRIAKSVDGQTLYTVYNGHDAWADFDSDGNLVARYLHGEGIDEKLARYRPGEGIAWYLSDKLGTVRDMLDDQGGVANHIDYSPFGTIISQTNPPSGDRFTFTGRERDEETGLYYYRARYYDPVLGRFLNQDPLGFNAGDINLYRYVGNHPVNAIDPLGQSEFVERGLLSKIIHVASCEALELVGNQLATLFGDKINSPLAGTLGQVAATGATIGVCGSPLTKKPKLPGTGPGEPKPKPPKPPKWSDGPPGEPFSPEWLKWVDKKLPFFKPIRVPGKPGFPSFTFVLRPNWKKIRRQGIKHAVTLQKTFPPLGPKDPTGDWFK